MFRFAFTSAFGLLLVACGTPERGDAPYVPPDQPDDDTGEFPDSWSETGNDDDDDDDAEEGESSDSDDGALFDVGGDETGGPEACGCGNDDWSYLWVANREPERHTIAKIDTRTQHEEGRYLTRPDGFGSPSRTSVSIDGRAVVVANRHTGLTKVWARAEDCVDSNGMPGIQTSTGKYDVYEWGEDECIAWHVPFVGFTNQRPVQFTPGTLNEDTCEYEDQKIWTVTSRFGGWGECAGGGVSVHRLDAQTGDVEDTIEIPAQELTCTNTGPYGGATDADGNFWFHSWEDDKLVRVDFETLDYEVFPLAESGKDLGYGITVDDQGRVWLSGFTDGVQGRFDYESETWAFTEPGGVAWSGIAQGHDGRIWVSNGIEKEGLISYDPETLKIVETVEVPENGHGVKGVSVDVDGYVWAIRYDDARAFRINPETHDVKAVIGLNNPYTYSDMTGGAIKQVTCRPEG